MGDARDFSLYGSGFSLAMVYPLIQGFPGSSVVKNLPANVEDISDAGLIPGSGRSPGEGNGNPFRYYCLGNIMDRVPGTRRYKRIKIACLLPSLF